MGEVTYSELRDFNSHLWTSQASGWRQSATTATNRADELDAAAAKVEQADTSAAGRVAADAIRDRAEELRTASKSYATIAEVLTIGAAQMELLQTRLAELVTSLSKLHVDVDGDGRCQPQPTNNPIEFIRRQMVAQVGDSRIDTLLQQAAALDRAISQALLAREQLPPLDHSDSGPADLSIAGIEAAAASNSQGAWGNCVQLASLRALAAADPELLQRNVRWDPDRGVYWVTLYDPETGEALDPVPVDPNQMVDASRNSKDPDKVDIFDIYEQALITVDPTHSGEWRGDGMSMITGKPTEVIDHRTPDSKDRVAEALTEDPPRAVTTGSSSQDPSTVSEDKRIVQGHAYHVVEVLPNGNIVVQNPWGPDGGMAGDPPLQYPGRVELTPEEYDEWFYNTTVQGK